jgi:hypothetical protein
MDFEIPEFSVASVLFVVEMPLSAAMRRMRLNEV